MTTLNLTIEDLAPDTLIPWEAIGTEAISSIYTFEIAADLQSSIPPDPSIVGRRITLTITPTGCAPRDIHGVVDSFTVETPEIETHPAIVRLTLRPALSTLAYSRQNQLFGTNDPVTAPDVLQAEMEGTLRPGNKATLNATPFPYQLRIHDTYPPLDHLAQYQETNLDFISRIAERFGIFWWFENDADREQVVFADSNVSVPFIPGSTSIDWHGQAATTPNTNPEVILQLTARHERRPATVTLKDFNYRTPKLDLLVSHAVDPAGTGAWASTDERYLDPDQGMRIATVRAQEMQSHKLRLTGRSMAVQMAAGHAFELQNHPFDRWNRRYLILAVRHTARIPRRDLQLPPDTPEGYWNEFDIQPLDTQFRPERRTPQPRLPGLMQGMVEGASGGTGPMMDHDGRYKVRLPYDLSDSPDGHGSRWVRLATPFAGANEGMHFPLHPGTEVVVSHVNGDPDRPLILGAVFNPSTPNVVTGQDPLQNRINFRSGMGMNAITGNPAGSAGASDPTTGTTTSTAGNTVFVWAEETPNVTPAPDSNAATATPPAPSPYQWLRLGAEVNFVPYTDGSVSIPGASNDGFDLATGGVGRLFAQRDIYLMRNGNIATYQTASDSTANDTANRMISIIDESLTLSHDGTINIGEPQGGAGYPEMVTINAGEFQFTASEDYWSYCYKNSTEWHQEGTQLLFGGDLVTGVLGAMANLNVGVILNIGIAPIVNIGWAPLFDFTMESRFGYSPAATKLEALKTELTAFKTAVGDVDTKISTAKSDLVTATDLKLTTLKTDINTAINTKVGEVETKITTTETKVKSLDSDIVSIVNIVGDMRNAMMDMDTQITELKTYL